MSNSENYLALFSKLKNVEYKLDYSLKGLNRYGTGGNAKVAIFPKNVQELSLVLKEVKGSYPYYVIGGGSNLLVSDSGFDGVIISTLQVKNITIKSNLFLVDCGEKLSNVIKEMKYNCFSGLEFAVGIPATVGGAVAMNAGCFGSTISEVVKYVVADSGIYTNSECGFGYRTSRFLNGDTILSVCFSLEPSEEDLIEEKIKNYKTFRKNPKGKSCGSVFKNEGYFAGKVIDEVGLKGYKIGGAKVSLEHANFIIADNTCTSQNIYDLIKTIKERVYNKKQITLVEELMYLGDFK